MSAAKQAAATRDAEATKIKILDAAEEEFAKGGLLGARTDAIAANTGVTKSMIFYHFRDKEGLYQAVLERAVADRVSSIQMADLNNPDPYEALRAFTEAFLNDVGKNNHLPAIFFYEGIQNKGRFYGQIAIASLYKPLVEILKRGVEAGKFRPMDPLHAAVNLIGMCVFYFCSSENVKHLWPGGADLLTNEMKAQHKQEAIAQALASVRP